MTQRSSTSWRSFAVVPAAGRSRRMGRPKLLLQDGQGTLFERVVRAWQASRVTQTVVVVRQDDGPLRELCESLAVTLVIPQVDPPEMKDSVLAGLSYLRDVVAPGKDDAWLVAPADIPDLSPFVIDAVLAEYQTRPGEIVVPIHGGRRGHPVLFPWALATAAERLDAHEGLNRLLDRFPVRTVACGVEGIPPDIDTPEQFTAHQRNSRKSR